MSRPFLLLFFLLASWAWPALASESVAHGLIVGYRDAVNPLSREETDRGPWADRRARMASAWQRASQRSRERTERLAQDTGVRAASVGEAGRAALMRFDRPLQGQALADTMRRVRLHPDVAWVEPNVLVKRQAVPNDADYLPRQWHLRGPGDGEPVGLNLEPVWDTNTGSSTTVVAVVDSGVRFSHPELAGKLLAGYDFVSLAEIENDAQPGRDPDASDPGDWVTAAEANDASSVYYGCTWNGFTPPPFPEQDSSWHGTFIAGQIAPVSNNGVGVTGINWQARVLPVRVSGKCGALVSDLLDGVRWAAGLPVAGVPTNVNPARVINLSFNGDAACSPAYQDAVDDARAAGSLLVVAAGNNAGPPTRPGDCQGVMTVASVQRNGAKAPYSNFGANVALSAPGGWGLNASDGNNLWSTTDVGTRSPAGDTYGYKMGTSFAAPQAAGVASLMLAVNPHLTPQALMERMKAGARPHEPVAGPFCAGTFALSCRCTASTCGAGLLDAQNALQLADGPAAVIQPVGVVTPGAFVALDGQASVALAPASIASYQWTQDSGTTSLAIPGDTQAVTGLQLPAVEGRWVLRLTVTDSNGDTGSDVVIVRAVTPPAPPAPPSGGGGGGSFGLWWGLALMLWVVGLARATWRQQRRRPAHAAS